MVKYEWGAYSDPVQFVSVIGRGGEQISRIQTESGCKIQIASGKGCFFHRSQFGKNEYYAKFSRFSTLLVARSVGTWVSICDCCFPCTSGAGLPGGNQSRSGLRGKAAPLTSLETLHSSVAWRGPSHPLGPLFSAPECYARHSGACRGPAALGSLLGIAHGSPGLHHPCPWWKEATGGSG